MESRSKDSLEPSKALCLLPCASPSPLPSPGRRKEVGPFSPNTQALLWGFGKCHHSQPEWPSGPPASFTFIFKDSNTQVSCLLQPSVSSPSSSHNLVPGEISLFSCLLSHMACLHISSPRAGRLSRITKKFHDMGLMGLHCPDPWSSQTSISAEPLFSNMKTQYENNRH